MDVPKGPLRQDAELGRSGCESEDLSEITNTAARSRRVGQRQSGLGVPMQSSQERKSIVESKVGRASRD